MICSMLGIGFLRGGEEVLGERQGRLFGWGETGAKARLIRSDWAEIVMSTFRGIKEHNQGRSVSIRGMMGGEGGEMVIWWRQKYVRTWKTTSDIADAGY
jgi:hypothetical protein